VFGENGKCNESQSAMLCARARRVPRRGASRFWFAVQFSFGSAIVIVLL